MTSKQLEARFMRLVLWPLVMIAPFLRTNYSLEGRTITVKRPFRRSVSVRIDELDEIGVETTDQGPFIEDVFWVLKRGSLCIRIPDPHPVFKTLLDIFGSLEGFDLRLFAEAMSCTDNHYFLCWKRTPKTT